MTPKPAGVSVVGIPNDLPSEAVEAAARVMYDAATSDADPPWGQLDEMVAAYWRGCAVSIIRPAVPYIEAEIRAKIAAEIETKVDTIRVTPGDQYALRLANVLDGLRAAVRVARGTQETPNG